MLEPLKSAYSGMNRFLNRRRTQVVWVTCLLALLTISHLALVKVERTREDSTLQKLFQNFALSDRSLCGSACASTSSPSPPSTTDEGSTEEDLVDQAIDKLAFYIGESDDEEEIILPGRAKDPRPWEYQKDVAKKLSSSWTEEMAAAQREVFSKRRLLVKETCSSMNLTGVLSPPLSPIFRHMKFITKHRMIWCPVFKAASTTWVKNLLLIAGETKIEDKSVRSRATELYGEPKDPAIRDKIVKESQKMMIVRHPLERLLSAYRDKMLRLRDATDKHVQLQQDIMRLYPDPNNPVKPTKGSKGKAEGHPTFYQFLMKVRDDLQKAWSSKGKFHVNMHWKPVWLSCAPCQIHYDYIAKVESLGLEQEYIIRQMGLQDLLYNAHTHASNFDAYNTTSEAVKDYFRKVPRRLLQDVVELYRPDFALFDYSPDAYLELAIKEE